jgi:hypothetical protein
MIHWHDSLSRYQPAIGNSVDAQIWKIMELLMSVLFSPVSGGISPVRHAAAVICGAGLAALSLAPATASAQDFQIHVEPAAAIWLDAPQSDRFNPGFYLAIRPSVRLSRMVSAQLSWGMLLAPAADGFAEDGSAHSVLGGLRLRPFAMMRPESEQLGGFWVDANLGYVRTGGLDRFGFDTGIGWGFQVADWMALGPAIRYAQIVQPDSLETQGPDDAQFLTVGVNFTMGPRHREVAPTVVMMEPEPLVCPEEAICEPVVTTVRVEVPTACPDGDRDGLCDADDRCPDDNGPPATLGCPVDPCTGRPLTVLVQFDYDSASMPDAADSEREMDPVLDQIAVALGQDAACRVCITGFTSEEGDAVYNQELSQRRAEAVRGYLVSHGIGSDRMPVIGMGESCQLVPESSLVLNRRVDFMRLEEGESCPTVCAE